MTRPAAGVIFGGEFRGSWAPPWDAATQMIAPSSEGQGGDRAHIARSVVGVKAHSRLRLSRSLPLIIAFQVFDRPLIASRKFVIALLCNDENLIDFASSC
eukprot:GHVU01047333.1.p4 GENE.GHVU01047333.1~~GHVU01047333.1.p4  ORF type:complete len:100 (-),score=8.08 GHVU01047333.1:375-674(-)